ncbi:MAG: ZIP family metal transporter, partial [Nitrospinae bacterium]|nr:ZIP family metal transporter [Nitrospinota bacterium]
MSNSNLYIFLIFVFGITLLAGWIPTVKLWSQHTFRMLISFCAGILLGAVFFHMLPEVSPILGRQIGLPIVIGFLGIYVLEKFVMVHPCEEGSCDYHKIGIAAYLGIGFHSILDGVAIGAGSMLNLSAVILVAVTLHRFPAALALSSILVKGGEFSKKKILLSMFMFALATPVGAVLAITMLQNMDHYPIGIALGV